MRAGSSNGALMHFREIALLSNLASDEGRGGADIIPKLRRRKK